MNRRSAWPASLVLALFTPTVAHAHLVNSGVGPFYDGALHLLLSPMDIVRLIALCLFAGTQEPAAARTSAVVAPITWMLAGAFAISYPATGAFALMDAAVLIVLGAVVAVNPRLPWLLTATMAAGVGGLVGFQSGLELASDNAGWVALLGAAVMTSIIIILALSFVVSATSFPARVACRVLGSWTAATGLLSIGWIIAGTR